MRRVPGWRRSVRTSGGITQARQRLGYQPLEGPFSRVAGPVADLLYPRLDEGWLLIADRNFCTWADWRAAADTGAALLWRVKADLTLPVLEQLPDGSYASVLISPKITGKARDRLIAAARARDEPGPGRARLVRVIEYEVLGRGGDELIALITTITDQRQAPAAELAAAYQQRWEHKTGNDQLKTHLRGPARSCAPGARTWSARRSTATSWPTGPYPP